MKRNLFFSLSLALLLTACGGSSDSSSKENKDAKDTALTAETTISGPLGKAYSVVEKNYKPQGQYTIKQLNVEIELTDPANLPESVKNQTVGTSDDEGDSKYQMLADFTLELLDADGGVVESKTASEGVDRLLRLTEKGDKATVSFYLPDNLSNIKSFRIVSDLYPNDTKADAASEDEEKKESSVASDEEFNKAMEHAEKAVETTTKMMKGVKDILN